MPVLVRALASEPVRSALVERARDAPSQVSVLAVGKRGTGLQIAPKGKPEAQ